MNEKEMEMARRLVACKAWVWLPGMRTSTGGRVCLVDDGLLYLASSEARFRSASDERECIPDISDDLTRIGVLEVARRAWGTGTLTVRPVDERDEITREHGGIPGYAVTMFGSTAWGRTELEALLASLESMR